jgi:hypothetical protein
MTFPIIVLAVGLVRAFSLSPRHIPFLAFHVKLGFVRGLICCFLSSSIPARKARCWTRLSPCISISLWFLSHYFLGDTRDRAGSRNVQFCSSSLSVLRFVFLTGRRFYFLLCGSFFCMVMKGQMALIGVKEGIRNRFSHWDAPSRGNRITCSVTALANHCDGRMVGWLAGPRRLLSPCTPSVLHVVAPLWSSPFAFPFFLSFFLSF